MLANPNNIMCFGLDVFLPGPDRKRTTTPYHYYLTYRRPELESPGCLMTWEVHGGRSPYQLALEREDGGTLQIHCTCADAVFRGDQPGHRCKHVAGFLQTRDLVPQSQVNWRASA
jgi:hypothetical protein